MVEIGAAIILVAFMMLSVMFFYFGVDDKNPAFIILGAAIFGGLLLMTGA